MHIFQLCFLYLSLVLFSLQSLASFELNQGLDTNQQKRILKILGIGTSTKQISRPQTLGVDFGLEINLSVDFINTKKISEFIASESDQKSINYPKFTIGKGLTKKIDLFVHFTPFTQTLALSEFGALTRYMFYKDTISPLVANIGFHASSANFNNQMSTQNIGSDVNIGLQWEHFGLSTQIGWISSSGKFTGGPQGVTLTGLEEKISVNQIRTGLGLHYNRSNIACSVIVDYFTSPVYTLKIGFFL